MQLLAWLCLPARIAAVLVWVLCGLAVQLLVCTWAAPRAVWRIVALWSRGMLACLGVRLRLMGQPTRRTALVVANHISWLDILAMQAALPVVFVAKSEIRHWPVLGAMVALAGTCFIDRSRRSALRGVHSALTDYLQAGQSVAIFPEGTTSDGRQVLPFHAGLFESAIAAQVPVQPVRLTYSHPAAAYVGDISLLTSAVYIMCAPRLTVRLQFGAVLDSKADRAVLCAAAYAAIVSP